MWLPAFPHLGQSGGSTETQEAAGSRYHLDNTDQICLVAQTSEVGVLVRSPQPVTISLPRHYRAIDGEQVEQLSLGPKQASIVTLW